MKYRTWMKRMAVVAALPLALTAGACAVEDDNGDGTTVVDGEGDDDGGDTTIVDPGEGDGGEDGGAAATTTTTSGGEDTTTDGESPS